MLTDIDFELRELLFRLELIERQEKEFSEIEIIKQIDLNKSKIPTHKISTEK